MPAACQLTCCCPPALAPQGDHHRAEAQPRQHAHASGAVGAVGAVGAGAVGLRLAGRRRVGCRAARLASTFRGRPCAGMLGSRWAHAGLTQVPEECPQEVADLTMHVRSAKGGCLELWEALQAWSKSGRSRVPFGLCGCPPLQAAGSSKSLQAAGSSKHALPAGRPRRLQVCSCKNTLPSVLPPPRAPQCLSEDPADRPTAQELLHRLHVLMERRPAERRAVSAGPSAHVPSSQSPSSQSPSAQSPSAQSPTPDFQALVADQRQ